VLFFFEEAVVFRTGARLEEAEVFLAEEVLLAEDVFLDFTEEVVFLAVDFTAPPTLTTPSVRKTTIAIALTNRSIRVLSV
jgi:hypothetical protein